jgi:hypothetical protein
MWPSPSRPTHIRLPQRPRRVPRDAYAIPISTGCIVGHRLTFTKVSKDGSGKCDAEFTGKAQDVVWGVLYSFDPAEKGRLDRAEGLGNGYAEKQVSVIVGGEAKMAVTYYATKKDPSLRPYDWYKEYVLFGARENGLPDEYIVSMIESVVAIEDPDKERSARERAILRGDVGET